MGVLAVLSAAVFVMALVMIYAMRRDLIEHAPVGFVVIGMAAAVSLMGVVLFSEAASGHDEAVWQPGAPRWRDTPVRLGVDPEQYPDHLGALDQAIQDWNRNVGCEVLRRVPIGPGPDVLVHPVDGDVCGGDTTVRRPVQENPAAAASTFYCGGPDDPPRADVVTRRLDQTSQAYRVFRHELGHVLGLAHGAGPMAARLSPEVTIQNNWPSEQDVKALRERYCR